MNDLFDNPVLKAVITLDDSPAMRAIRALENSPSIKIMCELGESPVVRAMRQIENSPAMLAIRQFEDSPAIRMIRDLENSTALKGIKGLEELPAFRAIQQLQEAPALRAMRALENNPAMEAFSRITEQINHGYGALRFAEALELLADEYDHQPDPETVDVLSCEVQERTRHAPRGVLSAEFYLNLVLALFLFYLSQMSALESEEKIIERMNSFEQTIVAQLNVLDGAEKGQLFLVPDRTMYLRSGPGMDNDVIGAIHKNQKLMDLERDRDWVKVEYFDHVNNLNVVGWAHSQYLLVINSDEQR